MARSQKLALFLDTREDAIARGDYSVVACMNAELDRLGWNERTGPLERHETVLEAAVPPPMEQAVPAKPKRGRPPSPRCEHDMLVDRCPTCAEDSLLDLEERT